MRRSPWRESRRGARTSRAVLYRRWPNRPELVVAALRHHTDFASTAVPDTGTLRGDALALLRHMSARVGEVADVLSFLIADFFDEAGLPPAVLRERAVGSKPEHAGHPGPRGRARRDRPRPPQPPDRFAARRPRPARPDHDPGAGARQHHRRDRRRDLPAPRALGLTWRAAGAGTKREVARYRRLGQC